MSLYTAPSRTVYTAHLLPRAHTPATCNDLLLPLVLLPLVHTMDNIIHYGLLPRQLVDGLVLVVLSSMPETIRRLHRPHNSLAA
jgi:hypothetical protein